MVSKNIFVVFILPALITIIFASSVMISGLQELDRELNMWPMSGESHNSIHIIGLSSSYSISEPVEILVKIDDSSFDCGDLYVTVYSSGKNDVVNQGGFFEQCFVSESSFLPINDKFTQVIDTPGTYKIEAVMVLDGSNISTGEIFTVK